VSEEELPSRRASARFLTDLDLVISDKDGTVLDGSAQAHDISPKGFRAETKLEMKEGDVFHFSLEAEDREEEPITGRAQVAWTGQNPWGGTNIGVKITKISWRDSRRLAANLFRGGYDFAGLARKAMRAVWWVVLIAGINSVVFHQPTARKLFIDMAPVLAATFFFACGLLLLVKKD